MHMSHYVIAWFVCVVLFLVASAVLVKLTRQEMRTRKNWIALKVDLAKQRLARIKYETHWTEFNRTK